MNIYYVYAYVRSSDGTPYYIGKGKNNRAWEKHRNVTTPKDKSKIIIMESGLTEIGAISLERRYIRWYGRKNNKTGILRNMTDGGDGISGFHHSEETKIKVRNANIGKTLSTKTVEKMRNSQRGKTKSKHIRDKMSVSHKGKVLSDEHRKKISNSMKGKSISEETKIKLSIAAKKYHLNLKSRQ